MYNFCCYVNLSGRTVLHTIAGHVHMCASSRVGTQVLYKQNDPYTIRVNLMYAGPPVLRVTFMYKGSILCATDPYTIRVNLM